MRETSRLLAALAVACLFAMPCRTRAQSTQPARNPKLPTLWLVGDSTVKNGSGHGGNGQWGWGDRIAKYFDTTRINVVNRARGGRSSRSYINEGLWAAVLKDAKPGDFVLIQMGHNDGGPLAGDNRERGSIRGTGDESKDVTLTLPPRTGQHETVYTYGHYLRQYISDARAHGLTPMICSPIPHRPKSAVRPGEPEKSGYVAWSEEVATAEHVPFVPLNTIVLSHYVGLSPDELKAKYFTKADDTHTSAAGADLNAASVVEGLRQLKKDPLTSVPIPSEGRAESAGPKHAGEEERFVPPPRFFLRLLALHIRRRRRSTTNEAAPASNPAPAGSGTAPGAARNTPNWLGNG